jgi:site-specific DNA recombinase
MANSSAVKPLRCAIYTRKSTEHGLELEFNSLHAQREACEAYIKSQASLGWKALSEHYDDPAYSGGNLERPALQRLLDHIEAGRIDVIVVYKIDRLTRSLADFAKLVEAFDAKQISFVAVTQQFNTSTSMGRLTLNVLLSFAQFERELSSERVRDKVAASRRKGKWTGGSVPLGYDAIDKKLVINQAEAKSVRIIFSRYLELKSFQRLIDDLNAKGIVTKKRNTKVTKYHGGIPFTYGSLAHFLKNRVYIGETGHAGKWYSGEHEPILDHTTFDRVQDLLKSNSVRRQSRRTESGALLAGKLFDDKGNRMSPSYSVKNGVRYRFYVSSALLRGRKSAAGSVTRVPAREIEAAVTLRLVEAADDPKHGGHTLPSALGAIEQVTVKPGRLIITTRNANGDGIKAVTFEAAWSKPEIGGSQSIEDAPSTLTSEQSAQSIQQIVRAHAWLKSLTDGHFESIEDLAGSAHLHPKVLRQQIQFAFLSPGVVARALAVVESAT